MPQELTHSSPAPTREELRALELFSAVDIAPLEPLLVHCPVRELQTEEALIRAGDVNSYLYLVLSGRLRVHLQSNDEHPVALVEAGESIGEISIIDQQPSSANVVADCPTRLLVLDEETLWTVVRSSHSVAVNLLQGLAQRLRYGNAVIQRIQELLREYEYDATIDPLTGLYNRRWLNNMLRRLMQRCASGNEALSVVMIDIDFFKQYNDTHGHIAGDRALHAVARCLMRNLRPEDTITRYGGEELLGILPGSDAADARMVAERLRIAVGETPIQLSTGEPLPSLTISLGIAQMQAGQSPEQLIGAADAALYRAKRAGRNRVSE